MTGKGRQYHAGGKKHSEDETDWDKILPSRVDRDRDPWPPPPPPSHSPDNTSIDRGKEDWPPPPPPVTSGDDG